MGRRTREDARETRNRLLDTAEAIFRVKGVARTSLADIADATGVTRGAIYWHFANKADLFAAMFDRRLLPLDELAEPTVDHLETAPLAHLREHLIRCMESFVTDDTRRCIFEILLLKCEFVAEMGSVRKRHKTAMRVALQRIELALQAAVKENQLPSTLDTRLATIMLYSMLSGILRNSLMLPGLVRPERDTEALIDACFESMRSSASLRTGKT